MVATVDRRTEQLVRTSRGVFAASQPRRTTARCTDRTHQHDQSSQDKIKSTRRVHAAHDRSRGVTAEQLSAVRPRQSHDALSAWSSGRARERCGMGAPLTRGATCPLGVVQRRVGGERQPCTVRLLAASAVPATPLVRRCCGRRRGPRRGHHATRRRRRRPCAGSSVIPGGLCRTPGEQDR